MEFNIKEELKEIKKIIDTKYCNNTKAIESYERIVAKFNQEQTLNFIEMRRVDKMRVCFPVGCGKGYLIFADMYYRVLYTQESIFTIATHRRLLNKQHLKDIMFTLSDLAGQIVYINVGSGAVSSKLEKYFDIDIINKCKKCIINYMDENFSRIEILKNNYTKLDLLPSDVEHYIKYLSYKENLKKQKLDFSQTIISTTNAYAIRKFIEHHLKENRKIVIVSTYDSLGKLGRNEGGFDMNTKKIVSAHDAVPIDAFYADEAHMLASEEETEFFLNFMSLNVNNRYFFTATPKESADDNTSLFLMDNEHYFGKLYHNLSFKQAASKGYIISPYIHAIEPSNYQDFENNIVNRANFILQAAPKHKEVMDKMSSRDDLGVKLLVKCKSIGSDMWPIYKNIVGKLPGYKICAGGYERKEIIKPDGVVKYIQSESYMIDDVSYSKEEYLEKIQKFGFSENIIVLHFDIFSEGINVSGFTAIMFLSGNLLSENKIIQNLGRGTRLTFNDREKLGKTIFLSDKNIDECAIINKTWEKPFFAIIVPYWDDESYATYNGLVNLVCKLRSIDFMPKIIKQGGNDKAIGTGEMPTDSGLPDIIDDGINFDDDFLHIIEMDVNNLIEKENQKKENDKIEKDENSLLSSITPEERMEYIFNGHKMDIYTFIKNLRNNSN